jgi:adenylate cyclase
LKALRSTLREAACEPQNREIEWRPKSFEVLRFPVENADRVVTKEELIRAVWPNVIVTDDVLAHCISEVRNALGDDQRSVVKTVPRRGYRFAAPVAPLSKRFAAPPPQAAAAVGALFRS